MTDAEKPGPPSGKASAAQAEKTAGGKPCPTCGKPGVQTYKPFCSKRCADVDLARWLKGSYAIPAKDDADAEDEGPPEKI